VVLSEAAWRGYFHARPDVIDQLVRVDTTVYRVIGVLPGSFVDPLSNHASAERAFLVRAEPPLFERGRSDPGWVAFWVVGRLRPGATVAQADAEVERLMAAKYPTWTQRVPYRVQGFHDTLVERVRPTLWALLAAVGFVLLIACANVANLLLSRASARVHEMAVRSALGASRSRLVAQLLAEGILLSLLAAAVGIALAMGGMRVAVTLLGTQLPRAGEITIDWRVVLFALLLAAATALVFALAPALQLTGDTAGRRLRESGRGAMSSRAGRRLRHSLVVVETALAVVLLSGAGLLLRTLWSLQSTETGFDAESVVFTNLGLPFPALSTAQEQELALNEVLARLAGLPGVSAAGAISDLPMSGALNSSGINRPDLPDDAPNARISALVRAVAGDYFQSMRVTLVRGRLFGPDDRTGTTEVAIVNDEFARRMFPAGDALGRWLRVRDIERQVVGVVGSVKEFTVAGELEPALYTPYAQTREDWIRQGMTVVVRAASQPAALGPAMQSVIRNVNANLTISTPRTMHSVIAADVAAPRFRAWLVLAFAALAVVLAGLGIGSVLAYTVAQRVPEIGVRLALGAAPLQVVWLVVRESTRLAGLGVLFGLAGALAAGRLLSRFLYGVQPSDPAALAAGTSALLLVALAASWLPARRGARVEPASVLRGP
jgi:predicted permease